MSVPPNWVTAHHIRTPKIHIIHLSNPTQRQLLVSPKNVRQMINIRDTNLIHTYRVSKYVCFAFLLKLLVCGLRPTQKPLKLCSKTFIDIFQRFPAITLPFILVKQVLQAPGQNSETMAGSFIVIADTVKAGSGAGRSGQDEVSPRYCPRRPTLGALCRLCKHWGAQGRPAVWPQFVYRGSGDIVRVCV